jgi:hypothetical protein
LKSSKCEECNRIHDSDNPYILVKFNSKSIKVFLHCYQNSNKKGKEIGEILINDELSNKIKERKRKYRPKIFEPEKLNYVVTNVYNTRYIQEHNLNKRFSLI